MKWNTKPICYVAHPFGTRVILLDNMEDFTRMFFDLTKEKPKYIGVPDGFTSELESTNGDHLILIGWFENNGEWRYSTLAHECSHAAFRICHQHGVKLKWDNNETHAYLLSEMMDTFLE